MMRLMAIVLATISVIIAIAFVPSSAQDHAAEVTFQQRDDANERGATVRWTGFARADGKHTDSGKYPDLFNATILQLYKGLEDGHFTSQDLIKAYLQRIDEVNEVLHAVIETAPREDLLRIAKDLDEERRTKSRGYLHGIPILVKDNIGTDVSLGMNTTAGSFSLLNSVPPMDAPIIAELRKKGAIIIGKANMSVFAQNRDFSQQQGLSPRGGATSSAFYLHGNPCSSSSGSGVAASIGLAAATLGSETDGSIICPSSRNGVVGIKPSIGFASRFGIIPISSTQDSAGPIVRTVDDAAIVLTGMFTPTDDFQKSLDDKTGEQPSEVRRGIDYAQDLLDADLSSKEKPLAGVRLGTTSGNFLNATANGFNSQVVDIFHEALDSLREGGAELVNVTFEANNQSYVNEISNAENTVLFTEQRSDMETYLSYLKEIPSGVIDLGSIVEFANQHPEIELPPGVDKQGNFLKALQSPKYAPRKPGNSEEMRKLNSTYAAALASGVQVGKTIDDTLAKYSVDALVAPSDSFLYSLSAKAGYPTISVPMGFLSNSSSVKPIEGNNPTWPFPGAPAGLNFAAEKWSEAKLLRIGRGYEVMQMRKGLGGYDGQVRTIPQGTPKTQLQDVV